MPHWTLLESTDGDEFESPKEAALTVTSDYLVFLTTISLSDLEIRDQDQEYFWQLRVRFYPVPLKSDDFVADFIVNASEVPITDDQLDTWSAQVLWTHFDAYRSELFKGITLLDPLTPDTVATNIAETTQSWIDKKRQ